MATTRALPLTLDERIDATAQAVANSKSGKAAGRDKLTNEIMKAAGPPFIAARSRCLQRSRYTGPPLDWLEGKMWPGKRQQHVPLDPTNARGLLCASRMGQLFSTTLRDAAVSYISPRLGPDQQGARTKASTELPVMIRRFLLPVGNTAWYTGGWTVL